MRNSNDNNKRNKILVIVILGVLCVFTLVLGVVDISFTTDSLRNTWIKQSLSNTIAVIATVIALTYLKTGLFRKPSKVLHLIIPCVVALNNFPFFSYFSGNMQLLHTNAWDFLFFAWYCLSIGLLEEFIFRGLLFSLLADCFTKDREGLIKTFVISSLIFGLSHLINLISGAGVGATLLQVGYTTLTGGLFAFVLIKTKNLLCCAGIHALYNFCGLLMDSQTRLGLGAGVVFDLPTVVLTVIIAVIAIIYVLYHLFTYKETERTALYSRLGVIEGK